MEYGNALATTPKNGSSYVPPLSASFTVNYKSGEEMKIHEFFHASKAAQDVWIDSDSDHN
jgi:hypothetical protein